MMLELRRQTAASQHRSSFVRGVLTLAGGTIGAQAILILASPILTRLYTPEMFGVMAVFVGFSTVLSTLATWRYEIAIPQADSDQAAASVAALCFGLTLLMFALSTTVVFFFQDAIVRLFQLDEVASFLWMVPLFILSIGLYQILTYWNYRRRQFGSVAQSVVGKNVGMVGIQTVFYSAGAITLLLGHLLSQFLAAVLLLRQSSVLFRQKVTVKIVRQNAKRFRKYPMLSSWSGFTGSSAQQAPMLMFAVLFSPIQAGLYSLAHRIIGLPGALVGQAVSNVFLPHAADAYREGNLGNLLREIHLTLSRLATPAVIVLAIAAPQLFELVFGDEWREAGHYAQWLTVMLYAQFMYSPVSTSFGIMDRQEVGLLLHVGLLIASVSSIWVGASIYSSTLVTVALYSIANAVLYVCALAWIHRKAGGSAAALVAPVASSFLRSSPIALPLLIIAFVPVPLWAVIVLVIAALLFIGLYYMPLLRELRQPASISTGQPD